MQSRASNNGERRRVRRSGNERRRRRLQFEALESRRVLAQATAVVHSFREDDFSVAGGFTYQQHIPDQHDYIDTISNGRYTSSSGHVKWTSATDGTGFFVGTATGDGRDTVQFGGRRNCSEYGIEDKGRMSFTLDAQKGSLRMDNVETTSTRYTYYRDLTGGRCPAANPPYSRFFGGLTQHYAGTFAPATHQVAVNYSESNPALNVTAPSTDLSWTTTAATDMALIAVPKRVAPVVPAGFAGIAQTTQPPAAPGFVDVKNGAIDLTVNLSGKPVRTATPQTPVATIRAFWASSETDTSGAEIPLTSTTTPLGLFWNSSKVQAIINQFPTPPTTARFVRVAISATGTADADPANSTRYLRIGEFQAHNSTGNSVQEDVPYVGSAESILHALDRADPTIKTFAYQTLSNLGAKVEVHSDSGAYSYDATGVSSVQALGVGEFLQDSFRFVAVKSQTLLSEATLSLVVQGANDTPVATDDAAATTNFHTASILPSALLGNDFDPDQTDGVQLRSVGSTSQLGGAVQVVKNEAQTEILEIRYDPSKSTTLHGLAVGQKMTDRFSYEIVDRNGGTDSGEVIVEVTGEQRFLSIAPVGTQYTTSGTASALIPLSIDDPDGDSSDVQLSGAADDAGLVPPSGVAITKQGTDFFLRITPAASGTGRTNVTLTARNGSGHVATARFTFIVGSETDLDLDGVPNQMEDAAPESGDMNRDGIPDSRQAHVTSVRPTAGTDYLSLALTETQFLQEVAFADGPAASGEAEGAQFPFGLLRFQVLTEAAGGPSTLTLYAEDGDTELNRLFEYDDQAGAGQVWTSLMHNKRDGARVFADRIVVSLKDGGRGDSSASTDGLIQATVALAHVPHPWQNVLREDIDNDGIVAPLDALQLINQLNYFGSRPLGMLPAANHSLPGFLDPSGNDNLEPIDALIVINYLNNRSLGSEGAVGEDSSSFLIDEELVSNKNSQREIIRYGGRSISSTRATRKSSAILIDGAGSSERLQCDASDAVGNRSRFAYELDDLLANSEMDAVFVDALAYAP